MTPNFRKTALIVLTIGALTITSSCKNALDFESPSSSSPEQVFESAAYTNSALIGVYNKLIGDNGYGNRLSSLFPLSADDFKTSGNFSPTDRRGISMYGASSENTDLLQPFIQLYSGIERANLCIKYIPLSKAYTSGSAVDQAAMKRYYGEALALRAQFFYELIRNWGDVPASFVPAAEAETLSGGNVDRNMTYDRIIADLKIAAELVPWRSEITEYGSFRFTKGAIKGLRARIALARGGYAFIKDKMVRSADYLDFYRIALEETTDIITRPTEHRLNPVYENIFKSLHTTARLDNEHELMMEVAAYGTNASTDSKLGYYNGVRFNSGSTFGQGGSGINVIPTYFYEFDKAMDVRRDVTIGLFEINNNSKKILNPANTITDGKFRKSWTAFNSASSSQQFAVNWPILRFADVVLMFAEADNEINGAPSAAAIAALQSVQKRAYIGFESLIPATPTDKDGFFTALVKERLLEFGGEGIRKYDLIRWNLLETMILETREKLTQFMNGTGPYVNVPRYVYAKEGTYNQTNSTLEVATLDTYGGSPNVTLFRSDATITPPATALGYTTKNWRAAVTDDPVSSAINGTASGFAIYFEPGRQLLPYPNSVLIDNTAINQNFSY